MKRKPSNVLSATDARRHLGETIDRAVHDGQRFMLTYRNVPIAVLLRVSD